MTGKTQYETPHMMTEYICDCQGRAWFSGGSKIIFVVYYLGISRFVVKEKEKRKTDTTRHKSQHSREFANIWRQENNMKLRH